MNSKKKKTAKTDREVRDLTFEGNLSPREGSNHVQTNEQAPSDPVPEDQVRVGSADTVP